MGSYILMVILICFSAFFSGSEISYASANQTRLKKAAENGGLAAKTAYYISTHFNRGLTMVLIGNNLVNIATASVGAVVAMQLLGPSGAAVSSVIVTIVLLIFGEIVPKIVAKERPENFATKVALPLRFMMFIIAPIISLITAVTSAVERFFSKGNQAHAVTQEELSSIIETADEEGVLDEEESELMQSALDFDNITAEEIITPRVDVEAVDIGDSYENICKEVMNTRRSRLPVYEGSIDNIIGVLVVKTFLKHAVANRNVDIHALLMPVCRVYKTMNLAALLSEMKASKIHMAVVTDEYGGTMGIVTMEDCLEQLVGDIWDESDEVVEECVQLDNSTYEVNGDMNIHEFFEMIGYDDRHFESEYTTVGGWAIENLECLPHVGDSFTFDNMIVTVREVDDLRILKLVIEVHADENKEKND